jgi:hypothetical protein
MRLDYIFFLMLAIFITGLADGITWALTPLGGIGFVLGVAIAFSINVTMGVGLLLPLLALNEMYHPRISPFGIVAGLIPGLNVLPFWVGLVIAGIIYKRNAEGKSLGGVAGAALKLQSVYQSGTNPFSAMREAGAVARNSRRTSDRYEASQTAGVEDSEERQRTRTLPTRRLPSIAPHMNEEIRSPKTHAQPA